MATTIRAFSIICCGPPGSTGFYVVLKPCNISLIVTDSPTEITAMKLLGLTILFGFIGLIYGQYIPQLQHQSESHALVPGMVKQLSRGNQVPVPQGIYKPRQQRFREEEEDDDDDGDDDE